MKIVAALLLSFALAACALPTFEPAPPPTTNGGYSRNTGDVLVSVPENRRDRRAERGEAAAECAQYGRVEQRRGDGDYVCVRPADRAPADIWE